MAVKQTVSVSTSASSERKRSRRRRQDIKPVEEFIRVQEPKPEVVVTEIKQGEKPVVTTQPDNKPSEQREQTVSVSTSASSKHKRSRRRRQDIKPVEEFIRVQEPKPEVVVTEIKQGEEPVVTTRPDNKPSTAQQVVREKVTMSEVQTGTIQARETPKSFSGKIEQARFDLLADAESDPNQVRRTLKGTGSIALAGAQGVVQTGEAVVKVGQAAVFLANPFISPLEKGTKIRGVALGVASVISDPKRVIQPVIEEAKVDPVGALARIGGQVAGLKVLSTAIPKPKIKATGEKTITGVTDTQQFAAGEGVVKVKPFIGKTKEIPFQSKQISDVVRVGDDVFTTGKRTVKIGEDIIESQVRTISKASGDSTKTLSVVKGKDTFGELTTSVQRDGTTLSRTQIIKETPKGLEEAFRTVSVTEDIGKIGTFKIDLSVGLGTKVKDTFKAVGNKLIGKIDDVPVGGTTTAEGTQLGTTQLKSSFEAGTQFQAKTFVSSRLTPQKITVVIPKIQPVVKQDKVKSIVTTETVPKVKQRKLTKTTVPSPRVREGRVIIDSSKITQVQRPRISGLSSIKQEPVQTPTPDIAQTITPSEDVVQQPRIAPIIAQDPTLTRPVVVPVQATTPTRPTISFFTLPTSKIKFPEFQTSKKTITPRPIKQPKVTGQAETLFRIFTGKSKPLKRSLLGRSVLRGF